jgi:histidyl-tRNA synthetase
LSKTQASLPKGTRDFNPEIMARRNYIFDIIRSVFEKFGFQPLETPALENLSVLTGKYGEEGDQLMFKVLNSGDFLKDVSADDLQTGAKAVSRKITEKALRYDLTVPLARFVVMNRGQLTFPFKRYQIQPVWRADRPQRGRYREFYQCDADVLGTNSLLCEAEIVLMITEVLTRLGLTGFSIKINHRQVLRAIVELSGHPEKEVGIITAIDKLDKIGWEGVTKELAERGIEETAAQKIKTFFDQISEVKGFESTLDTLRQQLPSSGNSTKGIADLTEVWQLLKGMGSETVNLELDATLARGLSYYTGCIFEVKVNNVKIGSISGGGRYDNLTGSFGVPGISGVGFSFGVDRMYDVLEELQLFPEAVSASSQLLFTNFDTEAARFALPLLSEVRAAGIRAELYPDAGKLKKQLDYANAKRIPLVALIGSDEIEKQAVQVKDMQSGKQELVSLSELAEYVKSALS